MCGLAGVYKFKNGQPPARDELRAMVEMLHHRGPDGYGFYTDGQVGLGHARLSIIDIEGGDQPIHNEDKTVWVVFNGEIFNYIELRKELIKAGHIFYTHSDTEVIVHLYEEFGEEFAQYLNGQFAIALWDTNNQKLILLRDRPGIHPLFYCQRNGRFLFASEAKALLPLLDEAPRLNPNALDQIMTFWTPIGSTTIFENIFQVLPGEIIVADRSGIQKRLYWQWAFPSDDDYLHGSEKDLAEELHDCLLDATRLRLRSDVPVGAYLSGGLDSSVITTLIHENNAKLKTFSIGFEDENLDEGSFQRELIEHLSATHSRIECKASDIGGTFLQAIWHLETPIVRTAPVPMMLLSRLVHEHQYKVVLTGEGADEVLGGYDLFKEAKIRQFWSKQPDSAWRPLLLKRLYPYLDVTPGRAQAYLQSFYRIGLDEPDAPHFSHLPRWITTAKCKEFLTDDVKNQLREDTIREFDYHLPKEFLLWHPFNRAQYIEAKTLMSGYLLCSQGDRVLMANSVEGRFPFLDHRVIEFANQLAPRVKMKVLNEKYLLKRAMSGHLPARIVARHKQPYRAPDIASFLSGAGAELAGEMLSEDCIRRYGYFDPKKVSLLFRKARSGRAIGFKDNMAFISILSTQIWHNVFIENFCKNFQGKPYAG